jgi:hypothetical protein
VVGDRIILKNVDAGKAAEDILEYYLNGWDEYKPNMERMIALERARVAQRDRRCDITGADLLWKSFYSEQLFWNVNHPKAHLIVALFERLLDECRRYEPSLEYGDLLATTNARPEIGRGLCEVAVPVHPGVSAALRVEWEDRPSRYQQYGGVDYDYVEYFDALIRYSIRSKETLRAGAALAHPLSWGPPLTGPISCAEITGSFPDGFIGPSLTFRATAEEPLSGLSLRAYCPAHHRSPLSLTWLTDDAFRGTISVAPSSAFTIEIAMELEQGQSVMVELRSATVMNLFERGESEDRRDLSVIILAIEALPAERSPEIT